LVSTGNTVNDGIKMMCAENGSRQTTNRADRTTSVNSRTLSDWRLAYNQSFHIWVREVLHRSTGANLQECDIHQSPPPRELMPVTRRRASPRARTPVGRVSITAQSAPSDEAPRLTPGASTSPRSKRNFKKEPEKETAFTGRIYEKCRFTKNFDVNLKDVCVRRQGMTRLQDASHAPLEIVYTTFMIFNVENPHVSQCDDQNRR